MVDYNLGKASGKIELDYDGTGAKEAIVDLDKVTGANEKLDESLTKTSASLKDTSRQMQQSGTSPDGYVKRLQDVKRASDEVDAAEKDAIGEDNAAGVTLDSIRNHAERHFDVQNAARATYREIVERRAREAQIDYVNGVATALTPMALYECVMNEAFRQLVAGDVAVSIDAGLRAAEKLQALTDARAGEADVATLRAQMGRVIEFVREFVPREQWPALQARLRGEEVERRKSAPVESVRVVEITDSDDDEGNW
jgi:hypothetical protein